MSLTTLIESPNLGAGNFFALLAQHADQTDQPAIHLDHSFSAPDGKVYTSLTIGELDVISQGIASWYYQKGIRAKDPVALYFNESVQYLVHYAALSKLGAIPVFLNSSLGKDIAVRFISMVGAVALVTDRDHVLEQNLPLRQLPLEDVELGSMPFPSHRHHENDTVLLAHTSGTTGLPKAVQFSHHGFFFGIKQQIQAGLGSRVISALPQSHASAISIVMSTLVRGNPILLLVKKLPSDILAAVQAFRPDLFVSFPQVYVELCRLDLEKFDLGSISYWLSTGDANHESHIRKLIRQGSIAINGVQRKGSMFIDNLGSSEFGYAMFRLVHTPFSNHYNRWIGDPFEWVDVEIFDELDQPCPTGVVGRLGVKASCVTAGYWNNTLLTEKNRINGYWLTGDLAFKDEKGRYFHVDRIQDKIDTVWGTIYSCQTEEWILKNVPEIFDCSLVGVQESSGVATKLVLVVELNSAYADTETDGLLQQVNKVMAQRTEAQISHIVLGSPDEHVGVTGKKLKREMRQVYSSLT